MSDNAMVAALQFIRYENPQVSVLTIREGEETSEFWKAIGTAKVLADDDCDKVASKRQRYHPADTDKITSPVYSSVSERWCSIALKNCKNQVQRMPTKSSNVSGFVFSGTLLVMVLSGGFAIGISDAGEISPFPENPDLWKWLSGQEQPPEAINNNPVFTAVRSKVLANLDTYASPDTRATAGKPWVRGWDDFKKGKDSPIVGNQ